MKRINEPRKRWRKERRTKVEKRENIESESQWREIEKRTVMIEHGKGGKEVKKKRGKEEGDRKLD